MKELAAMHDARAKKREDELTAQQRVLATMQKNLEQKDADLAAARAETASRISASDMNEVRKQHEKVFFHYVLSLVPFRSFCMSGH